MTTILPLYSDPYYTYTIDLDNQMFRFTFRWNSRADQWMMSISDSEDNAITVNIPLVPAHPLLHQLSLERLEGEMFLLPLNPSDQYKPVPDPRRIYRTHFLVYDTFDLDD